MKTMDELPLRNKILIRIAGYEDKMEMAWKDGISYIGRIDELNWVLDNLPEESSK
jgi:hypothetical protein